VEVDAWFTNTAPVDAYRGAGRPEATYLLERLVTPLRLGDGPGAGRDPQAQLHHQLALPDAGGAAVRRGRLPRLHDKAEKLADVAGFAARKAASKAKGC
jgi:carbon-monoxide dehydrogenase large subunit